jgi:hypothetical protein
MRGAETAGEEPERYARPEADKREDTHGLVQPPQFHTGYTVHSTQYSTVSRRFNGIYFLLRKATFMLTIGFRIQIGQFVDCLAIEFA